MIDLCGRCGHSNDHVDKPCLHEAHNGDGSKCGCPSGVRTDVFECHQLATVCNLLIKLNDTATKSLILQQVATGQQVDLVYKPNGDVDVKIEPFSAIKSALILPNH